jgi:hypothetical protein
MARSRCRLCVLYAALSLLALSASATLRTEDAVERESRQELQDQVNEEWRKLDIGIF